MKITKQIATPLPRKAGRPRHELTTAEKLVKYEKELRYKREYAKKTVNVTLKKGTVEHFDRFVAALSEQLGIQLTKSQAMDYLMVRLDLVLEEKQ